MWICLGTIYRHWTDKQTDRQTDGRTEMAKQGRRLERYIPAYADARNVLSSSRLEYFAIVLMRQLDVTRSLCIAAIFVELLWDQGLCPVRFVFEMLMFCIINNLFIIKIINNNYHRRSHAWARRALTLPWKSWEVLTRKRNSISEVSLNGGDAVFQWRKTVNDCSIPTTSFL